MYGPALDAITSFLGPVQTDIGIISATITTPTAEIKIASQDGQILSRQIGSASRATAFVMRSVLNRV